MYDEGGLAEEGGEGDDEEGSTTKPSDFSTISAPFDGRKGDEEAARAMQSNAATLGSLSLIQRCLLGSEIVFISPKQQLNETIEIHKNTYIHVLKQDRLLGLATAKWSEANALPRSKCIKKA